MSDNRKLFPTLAGADYNSLSAVINKEYCKRHGYDFIYYKPHLPDNPYSVYNCKDPHSDALRHAAWSKLLSTSRALAEPFDYVVYIDSDCIFKDFDHKIESFIGEPDILITNDGPYRKTMPCSGFYICRVNDWCRDFIKEWYNVNIPKKNIEHSWEQAALVKIWKRPGVGLLNNGNFFYETEGQPLRHVTGKKKLMRERLPYFRAFLDQHEIPFDISDIRCEEFSTI
jgi:hypothetical protein